MRYPSGVGLHVPVEGCKLTLVEFFELVFFFWEVLKVVYMKVGRIIIIKLSYFNGISYHLMDVYRPIVPLNRSFLKS